jgi:hypothetical protein
LWIATVVGKPARPGASGVIAPLAPVRSMIDTVPGAIPPGVLHQDDRIVVDQLHSVRSGERPGERDLRDLPRLAVVLDREAKQLLGLIHVHVHSIVRIDRDPVDTEPDRSWNPGS